MGMFPGFVAWDSSENKGMFIHRWVAVALLIDLRLEKQIGQACIECRRNAQKDVGRSVVDAKALKAAQMTISHLTEVGAFPYIMYDVSMWLVAKLAVMMTIRVYVMQFFVTPAAQTGHTIQNILFLFGSMVACTPEYI